MKRYSTYITLAICLLVVTGAVVAFFIIRKRNNNDSSSVILSGEDNSTPATTLQLGSRGEEVKRLQRFLNTQLAVLLYQSKPIVNGKEISHLQVDGIFGAETQAAVVWYFGTTIVNTNQF